MSVSKFYKKGEVAFVASLFFALTLKSLVFYLYNDSGFSSHKILERWKGDTRRYPLQSDTEIKSIRIHDISGKLIIKSTTNKIDVSDIVDGLYIAQCRLEDGSFVSQKFRAVH